MLKSIALVLLGLTFSLMLSAQRKEGVLNLLKKEENNVSNRKKEPNRKLDQLAAGLGLGLDYGVLGSNFLFYPDKHLGAFVGLGYDFVGLGWNVGAKYRLFPSDEQWSTHPYLLAMYGINSVYIVEDQSNLNESFSGFTFGVGIEPKWNSHKLGYWSFAILFLIESDESKQYDQFLNDVQGLETDDVGFLPDGVRISVGYHFVIK